MGLFGKKEAPVVAQPGAEPAPGLVQPDHAKVAADMAEAETNGTEAGRRILADQAAAAEAAKKKNG